MQTFISSPLRAVTEIKPHKNVPKHSDLFDRAADFLGQHGYTFYVITEKALFRDRIDERVMLLVRYSKAQYPESERARVLEVLADCDLGIAVGSLMRKARVKREVIIHMIARKALSTGPKLLLDESAVVRMMAFAARDWDLSFERWFGVRPWGESMGARS
jgi:hypothetical protein